MSELSSADIFYSIYSSVVYLYTQCYDLHCKSSYTFQCNVVSSVMSTLQIQANDGRQMSVLYGINHAKRKIKHKL